MNVHPPVNLDAEQCVLGAVLLSPVCIGPLVTDVGLRPEHFSRDRYRVVFVAMCRMHRDGEPIDYVTLSDYLARHGKLDVAGGRAGVEALVGVVPNLGGVLRYGAIVVEHHRWRVRLRSAERQREAVLCRDEAAYVEALALACALRG